mgnify:CR=1 FL=1
MNGKNIVFRAYSAPEVFICEICAEQGFAGSPMGAAQNLTQTYWGGDDTAEY